LRSATSAGAPLLQLFSSEVPIRLNSDRTEKLRKTKWLISTILREISHLEGLRGRHYFRDSRWEISQVEK